jgi:hypothetical protein
VGVALLDEVCTKKRDRAYILGHASTFLYSTESIALNL